MVPGDLRALPAGRGRRRRCRQDDVGAFVSVADKIDTICGCFGVGLIPTGSADPYALRRSAIGILNILLERGYRLSLAGAGRAQPGAAALPS
ncbi:MAG: glycine--tRNA ligase subunit beta [Rhodopseudomonas palustris]|nr:glycine--tRNA ligase subunit beta [Rhodopseudomonas palustris]